MRVGVIGVGIMGTAMGLRLIEAEHAVRVTNRTRSKAQTLIDAGAEWRETPSAVALDSDVVITMVTDGSALEAVAFGADGVLAGLPTGSVHCDMSTIAPASAVAMARRYADAGKSYVQSPVLGSRQQIEQTKLLVLAGGDAPAIERCRDVWAAFAGRVWTFETVEQSSAAKLGCNTLIAQMIVGLGQTLAIAGAAGVPAETMLDVISNSALASSMYAGKGQAIVSGNYKANFVVRNLLKDLRLASDYAGEKGLPLPASAAARELFVQAVAAGFGDEDYSAVVKTIIPA